MPVAVTDVYVIYYPELNQFITDSGQHKLHFSDLPRLYGTREDANETLSRLRGNARNYYVWGYNVPEGTTWGQIVDDLEIREVKLNYR